MMHAHRSKRDHALRSGPAACPASGSSDGAAMTRCNCNDAANLDTSQVRTAGRDLLPLMPPVAAQDHATVADGDRDTLAVDIDIP